MLQERVEIKDYNEFIEQAASHFRAVVGEKRALLALSGGVDSMVCAALMSKAIGNKLTCIFVDTGLMRLNEAQEVAKMVNDNFEAKFISVDAEARFLSKLEGVTDPETKRKIIGEEFIRVFEEESAKLGQIDFLVQGTIYSDVIESGTNGGDLVKSHHNVGGLPEDVNFKEILEPLKFFYKDEVRQLGLALGLPRSMVYRQPFPGPGLAIRVIGEVTKTRLDTLRQSDYIYRNEIASANLDIWQYFAVLTDLKAVGVKNHKRTYGSVLALRAVHSKDAMEASFAHIPYPVLEKITARITTEVEEVTRVVYDITHKPPGTIEWE